MEESYIRGVNSELIRVLKDIRDKMSGQNDRLDTIISNQSEITISADNINLNTDTLESLIESTNSKLDSINAKSISQEFLNPTHLGAVAAGNTDFDTNVVLCNITEDNITVTVTAADDVSPHQIVLAPGWSPVIIKSIQGATSNTLVYGY